MPENVPATAKKPQDRKPKQAAEKVDPPTPAEESEGSAVREVEFHGYTYTVDTVELFDDRPVRKAFVEMRSEVDDSDAQAIERKTAAFDIVFDALIGDQSDRFDREQKDEKGRVTYERMGEFIAEALGGNSSGSPD